MKIIIGLAFIAIIGALAVAGFFMIRGKPELHKSNNMAKALAWRIGISVLLFVLLMVMYVLNLLQPTGIVVGS